MVLSKDGLPKQLQEQSDLAEEFLATLAEGNEASDEDTDETGDQEESSDGTEEEEHQDDGSADDQDDLETAEEEEAGKEESYKKRYESLQGKYNAEVPKLNSELRKLKEDIFERLGNIENQVEQPSEEEDDTAQFDEELEGYREQFGDDLLAVIEKISTRKAKELVGDSITPVSEKVDSVENAQIESAQAAFTEDLTSKVDGDWETLWRGEDQGFLDFLDSSEPNGFFTYREIAKKANDSWDAAKLSKVFNTYLETVAKPEETGKEKVADKVNQDRVAPARNNVEAEPDSAEAKIWTQADIAEFKEKDRKGKYSQEESEELWNDFLRAPGEGRITA